MAQVFFKDWILDIYAFSVFTFRAKCVVSCVLQVKDEQHQCSLGHLKIPLSQLLTSDDMTMNQRFQLSNSGPNSTLKMKIALRVLSSSASCPGVDGFVSTAPECGNRHGTLVDGDHALVWEAGKPLLAASQCPGDIRPSWYFQIA